jgi:hypothetical protein
MRCQVRGKEKEILVGRFGAYSRQQRWFMAGFDREERPMAGFGFGREERPPMRFSGEEGPTTGFDGSGADLASMGRRGRRRWGARSGNVVGLERSGSAWPPRGPTVLG